MTRVRRGGSSQRAGKIAARLRSACFGHLHSLTRPIRAFARAVAGWLLKILVPCAALGIGAGFPLYVGSNPEAFGPSRLASPVEGRPFARDSHRFEALRALPRVGLPAPADMSPRTMPLLDERPTGSLSSPAYRLGVRAVAGGVALIAHEGGLHAFRPGDMLPDGSVLAVVGSDGSIETRSAVDRSHQGR